jgi:hypothetical protein
MIQGIATALALLGASFGFQAYAMEMQVSTACAVTYPKGGVSGNDSLAAVLPRNGTFIFKPGGPGFIDTDGAVGIKVGWDLRQKGTLLVVGRRLDSISAPARAYIPRSYDNYVGGMSLFLVFPTPGCWEVTGSVGKDSLTFIVRVEKIGEGPSSHMHGPPPGWRVSK